MDLPYVLALPTYTATAWYHHKLPNRRPTALEPLLREVEDSRSTTTRRRSGRRRGLERRAQGGHRGSGLHAYTGLPADYLERSDLRVNAGEFEKNLLGSETTTGRLDTRFSGPTLDPMSQEAEYDPQSAAIASAYVSVFNDYVRGTLKFGENMTYKADVDIEKIWDYLHQPPGAPQKLPTAANVMPDLAAAMKQNPKSSFLMKI